MLELGLVLSCGWNWVGFVVGARVGVSVSVWFGHSFMV